MRRRPVLSVSLSVSLAALLGVAAALTGAAMPAAADVVVDDCQPTADGGLTCDTRPTGDILMDDMDARFGLFDGASPGWDEFDPFEAMDGMDHGNGS